MFSEDPDEDLDILTYIHDQIIDASGGVKGFHHKGLIQSALARPRQSVMGEDAYKSVYEKAGALLGSIANNHGFRDGNKRTAMAATSYFLDDHDIAVDFTNQEYEDFMLHVVNNKPSVDEIGDWLHSHSQIIPPTQWRLVDAQARNRAHPDTFQIPSEQDIDELVVGSLVKIGFEVDGEDDALSERIWIAITSKQGNSFTGQLDHNPATIRGLKQNDTIHFDAKDIMSIE